MGKTTLTQCPTQQKWFGLFLQGTEIQMGYATQANKPLSTPTIVRLLELVKREAEDKDVEWISNKLYKFRAAAAIAMCASLRGPVVFMVDLAGIIENINMGKNGFMPSDPMKVGVDLSNAPYVFLAMLGEFKGETGIRHH